MSKRQQSSAMIGLLSSTCSTCGGKLSDHGCNKEEHLKADLVNEIVLRIRCWGEKATHLEIAESVQAEFHPKSRFKE